MRLAAEQLRMVALGASPGNAAPAIVKLRSSDGRMSDRQIYVAAPQLSWQNVARTCGFTAGYLAPLLRSESQMNLQSADAPSGTSDLKHFLRNLQAIVTLDGAN